MSKLRLDAIVYGRVQGVSFRYYTQREARRLNISGWVANLPDGTVRVVAEGQDTAIRQLANFLNQGPPAARVEHVKADWLPVTHEFRDFAIKLQVNGMRDRDKQT